MLLKKMNDDMNEAIDTSIECHAKGYHAAGVMCSTEAGLIGGLISTGVLILAFNVGSAIFGKAKQEIEQNENE